MASIFVDNYGPVDYWERPNSPTESYQEGEIVVQRIYDTPWDTRWLFIRQVVGFATVVDDDTDGAYIQRTIPQAYFPDNFPEFLDTGPSNDGRWVYCTSLESVEGVKPTGWDTTYDVGTFELARCTFTFKSLPYRVLTDGEVTAYVNNLPTDVYIQDFASPELRPDPSINATYYDPPLYETRILRYVTKKIQPSSQHLVLPYGKMFFVSTDNKKIPSNNGINKLVSSADVIYTWHQVPSQDLNNTNQLKKIQAAIGTVNREPFDGYPAGTLLLTAVNNTPRRLIGGYYASDIELRMKYFNATDLYGKVLNVGHNWVLRFLYDANFTGPVPGNLDFSNSYQYTLLSANGSLSGRKLFDATWFRALFDVSTKDWNNLLVAPNP